MSEGIIKEFIDDAGDRMHKSVDSTRHEFTSIRTGRASPALLDRVEVDYYGARTPLKQLAGISAPEARLLSVTPYDKSSIKAIEKAIMESDVGLTPNNDGNVIRLTIPELTEERRKDLVKVARRIAEDGRVAIRNVRRDVMHDLRELKEAGEVGQDDEHRAEVELQKLTDQRIGELDEALAAKEKEILEV
ncbi:MAG: ribosome recycling factor [Thermoleophilaceae bacterium]|jgi:ribosome recycling factor